MVGLGSHFYCMDPRERDMALANYGFVNEGIAYHVISHQPDSSLLWQRLDRLSNASLGTYAYTTDESEAKTLRDSGYRTDQISNVPPERTFSRFRYPYFLPFVAVRQVQGTVPLYHLIHPGRGDHFYSTDESEVAAAARDLGYRQNPSHMITGFVFPVPQLARGLMPATEPMFRLMKARDPSFPADPETGPTVAYANVSWSQLRDKRILGGDDVIGIDVELMDPPARSDGGPEIEIWAKVDFKVRDWKEVRLFDADGHYFGESTFPQDQAGQGISLHGELNAKFVGRWAASSLAGASLVFSKAKMFGIHTGMYQLRLSDIDFFWGRRVIFTWLQE